MIKRPLLALLATSMAVLAAPAAGYDYRTLHLIEDHHTHAIIRVSGIPGDGDRAERGRSTCAGLDVLDRRSKNIARAFGRMFQRSSIHIDLILTSRVCRQIEAARLLEIGPVTEFPLLDPIDDADGETGGAKVEQLMSYLDGLPDSETALLIAHQATIEALTGETLGIGEGLVFTLPPFGEPEIRGRFGLPPL